MKRRFSALLVLCGICVASLSARDFKILLLGDIHYDLPADHDMEWLATRGDNLRQVTKEYTVWTRANWPAVAQNLATLPDIDAVVQLGDLSEGLAGNPEKAVTMAQHAVEAFDSLGFACPALVVKGNHDITGPGAKEAFDSIYLPAMSRWARFDKPLKSANYAVKLSPDILVAAIDPWNKKTTPALADSLLSSAEAKHKFVALHEPVIPVNYRCWHVLRRHDAKRQELIDVLARNNAIVLNAHLHKNGIASRKTPAGRITQIMVNTVVGDLALSKPTKVETVYDSAIVTSHPDWEPDSYSQRLGWIEAEKPEIDFYRYFDLPGYAILTIAEDGSATLEFYGAASRDAAVKYNISEIHSL